MYGIRKLSRSFTRRLNLTCKMLGTATVTAIAVYGFLKHFSPDSHYFSDYLTGNKNFTQTEVTQEIYPVVAYSNVVLTFLALAVTDLLRYKPVIIFGTVALVMCKAILYFGNTVAHMQLTELLYAISKSSNLAFNSYIYTQVDKSSYQYATAIVNIAPKMGLLFSSLVAQTLLSLELATLDTLIEIHIIAVFLSLLVSFSLPSANNLTDFSERKITNQQSSEEQSVWEQYKQKLMLFWKECKSTCMNLYLLKWCIWMVLSFGAIELVSHYYTQALWSEVSGTKQNTYNALVDTIYVSFSMLACHIAGKLSVDWKKSGDLILGLVSIVEGGSIIASGCSKSLISAYTYVVMYSTIFDASIVFCRAEMALHLKNFGLILGINLFLSIIFQSALTYVLTSKQGLALPIREQFFIVGLGFMTLGIVFVVKAIRKMFTSHGMITIQ